MENVGESKSRNKDFEISFSRRSLIKNLMGKTKSPLIIDIGGHEGESVFYLRNLFPDAIIHTFEPDPQSFQALSVLADQKTHCYNVALSDHDGEVSFFRNNVSHTNSIYKVNLNSEDSIYINKVRQHRASFDPGKFNQELKVTARRLDSVCKEHAIQEISLLKVDVQGAEAKVLLGAGLLLNHVDNVILEICFFDYYEHQSSFFEIEQILLPFSFQLFSISEISNNPMNGRTDWVEVIYRKKEGQ